MIFRACFGASLLQLNSVFGMIFLSVCYDLSLVLEVPPSDRLLDLWNPSVKHVCVNTYLSLLPQESFDAGAIPVCPSEFSSPLLRSVMADQRCDA